MSIQDVVKALEAVLTENTHPMPGVQPAAYTITINIEQIVIYAGKEAETVTETE